MAGFSATVNTKTEYHSKYSYSTKYSFGYHTEIHKVKTYIINSYADTLSMYLADHFKEDLRTRTPDDIVARYGTHVLTKFTVGGRLYSELRSSSEKENDYNKKSDYVKATMNVSLGLYKLNTDMTYEYDKAVTLNRENKEKKMRIRSIGGKGIFNIVFDPDKALPPIDATKWQESLYERNATGLALVDIDWSFAYPIYELINDPVKKAEIKAAVEKHIKNSQIEALNVKPLYRYYFAGNSPDHFYVTSWLGNNHGNYTFINIEGYVLAKQESGTVPLYRYYSSQWNDHFYVTSWLGSTHIGHFRYEGNEGYVYKNSTPGTVGFYRYFNPYLSNHFYCSSFQGYMHAGDYRYESIEGYLFPPK